MTTHSSLQAKIIQTTEISSILSSVKPNTLVLFDIDETLMHIPTTCGSKPWLQYIENKMPALLSDMKLMDSTMWYVLRRCSSYRPVEKGTAALIQQLQSEKNVIVMGLTARHYMPIIKNVPGTNLTAAQLLTVGIDLSLSAPQVFQDDYIGDGIIFSSGELKGPFLRDLFARIQYVPETIVFVDDRREQIESMNTTMEAMGIPCDCYWYTRLESEEQAFNPMISAIQLYYLMQENRMMDNQEAESLLEKHPDISLEETFLKLTERVRALEV